MDLKRLFMLGLFAAVFAVLVVSAAASDGSDAEDAMNEYTENFITYSYEGGSLTAKTVTADCTETEIIIPGTVTVPDGKNITAGEYAVSAIGDNFAQNVKDKLTKVTLPSGLISIGYGAFSGCSELTAVVFNDSLTEIGINAFSGTALAGELVIPDSVQKISSGAFADCKGLTDLRLGAGLEILGGSAFSGCTELKNLNESTADLILPEGLKTIGSSVFYDVKIAGRLVVPASVTTIDDYAFQRSGFTEAVVNAGIGELKQDTFRSCTALTAVELAPGIKTIGNLAFYDCTSLEAFDFADITSIGDNAFSNGTVGAKIVSIDAPELTAIGTFAFSGCKDLTSLTAPKLISVGNRAFSSCTKIGGELSFPELTEMGSGAFQLCKTIIGFSAEKLKAVPEQAFYSCKALETFDLINVASIGKSAFENTSLSTIAIPAGLTSIAGNPFCDNRASEITVDGGNAVYESRDGALYEKSTNTLIAYPGLKAGALTLPDGTEVGAYAFAGSSVVKVTLPSGITSIPEGLFLGCENLETVSIPSGVTTICSRAFSDSGLAYLTIPEGVTTIEDDVFSAAYYLSYISFPSSLQHHGSMYNFKEYYAQAGDDNPITAGKLVDSLKGKCAARIDGGNKLIVVEKNPGIVVFSDESTVSLVEVIVAPAGTPVTMPEVTYDGHTMDAESTAFPDTMPAETCAVHIKWNVINGYTVHFDKNGGEGTMADQQFIRDVPQKLSLNAFTRTGYTFAGWHYTSFGNQVEYTDGQSVIIDVAPGETYTLYAKWNPINYTVQFNSNGGEGTMEGQMFAYDRSQHLFTNSFTRIGYTFAGWNTQKDGSGDPYEAGALVKNLRSEDGTTVILYAQWMPITYIVSFDNGSYQAEGIMADQKFTYDQEQNLTANAFTRTGYTFAGWSESMYGDVQYTDGQSVKNLTDGYSKHLYAVWKPISYTIHFDANGGTGTTADQEIDYGEVMTLNPSLFTKKGHTFYGWNTEANGTGTSYSDGESVNNLSEENGAVITLYAQWTPITYTVKFDANGGNEASEMDMTYGVTCELTTVEFHRTGYTFVKWNTQADGNGTDYLPGQEVVNLMSESGTFTLYAVWEPVNYTVHFDANGGAGVMDDQMFTYDREQNLTANAFTRTGYTFAGWSESIYWDVQYTDGQSVKNLTDINGKTVFLYAKWTPVVHTITFDGNGSTSGTMEAVTLDYDDCLPQNGFARTGYTFEGWSTVPEGPSTIGDASSKSVPEIGEVTLYAQWKPITYTVSFQRTYGEGSMDDQTFTYDQEQNLTSNAFTRTGYTFEGWSTEYGGETVYTDGQSVKNLTDVDGEIILLYAKCTANRYTVHFDANRGTGTTADQEMVYGEGAYLNTSGFTRTGYTQEWNTEANGTGTAYSDGQYVKNLTAENGAVITLYAQWTPITYTVSFQRYSGEGSMDDQTFTYDLEQNLTANAFTRTGYTFAGWSAVSGGEIVYTDGQSVKNITDINGKTVFLYAKWTANTYTVKFDANGGTGTTADQEMVYDSGVNLNTSGFTRTGYTQKWNTEANGTGTSYYDGQSVKNLTAENGAVITLYAQWTPITYTVSFQRYSGEGSMDDQTFTYDQEQNLTSNAFTRTGYTFAGWSAVSGGEIVYTDGQSVKNITDINGKTVFLYAVWTPNTYKVHFDANGGTGTTADQEMVYGEGANLNTSGFTRTGYTQKWNTEANGTGTTYSNGQYVYDLTAENGAIITLYAQWTANTYQVDFFSNGGNGSMGRDSFTYDVEKKLSANQFTRTGYTFAGWSENGSTPVEYTDEQSVKNLASEGRINLYAVWTPNTYKVHFDANGGTGTTVDQEMVYGEGTNLNTSGFTRTGYTQEWNTEANGTGTTYYNRQHVNNLTSENGAVITLYAQWKPITYTVWFDNGSSLAEGSMDNQTFTYDQEQNLTSNAFTKMGHTFAGWSTEYGGEIVYTDGQSVKNLTDFDGKTITLVAKWTVNTYKVHFDANGGTGTTADQEIDYGEAMTLNSSLFTKKGHTFYGWNTEANGTGTSYSDGQSVINLSEENGAVITLYAQWTPITYTVTYVLDGTDMYTDSYKMGETVTVRVKEASASGWLMNGEDAPSSFVMPDRNIRLYAQSGSGFVITYLMDGVQCLEPVIKAENDEVTLPAVPVKTGYTVSEWKLPEGLTGPVFNMPGKSIVVSCTSAPNLYTVNFDANGGEGLTEGMELSYDDRGTVPVCGFTKKGYSFAEWNTRADGNGTPFRSGAEVYNLTDENGGAVTLYAQWTANTYTVKFDANGGNGAAHQDMSYDSPVKLHAEGIHRIGYDFVKWNTQADGKGTDYLPEQEVVNLTEENGADLILYAQWAPVSYKVHFDANGGNGAAADQEMIYGESANLSSSDLIRTGYTFVKWNTQADGKGTDYQPGQEVVNLMSESGIFTLYAVWEPVNYTVHFDANGGAGVMDDQMFTYDQEQNLTANAFTRSGYVFAGWSMAVGSDPLYADGQSVKNLSEENDAVITLYAQWTANTYTVHFDANGGEGTVADQQMTCGSSAKLNASGFTLAGHTFVKWNTQADGKGTDYQPGQTVTDLMSESGIFTLYAVWEPVNYTVHFDANGGAGVMDDQTFTYSTEQALTSVGFTKTGHVFSEWNTQADGKGTSYGDGQSVKNLSEENDAVITLYAQWTANTYTVRFDANGGEGTAADQQMTCGSSVKLNIAEFSRTGYTIAGWNTRADGNGASYSIGAEVIDLTEENGAVVTLYARWTPISYTVHFDANGGEGLTEDMGLMYDVSGTVPPCASVRTGHIFAGWNTLADGTGASYAAGADIVNLTHIGGSTVTLYALWTPVTYVVNFDANGGTGTTPGQDMTYGSSANLNASGFELAGHTFVKWNTQADGKGTDYLPEQEVVNLMSENGTFTLYAVWDPVSFSVVFEANGGAGVMDDQTFTYGTEQTLTSVGFTKAGHAFSEWNTQADGKGTSYADGQSVKNLTAEDGTAIALYAQWTANTYTVRFDANGGEGTAADQQMTYGTPVKLDAAEFSRNGHSFAGWNTRADGTGASYEAGAQVVNLSEEDGSTVTLYAQWTADTYTLTFDPDNGDEKTVMGIEFGTPVKGTVQIPVPTKEHSVFVKWDTEIPDTMPAENMEFKAVWETETFTVTLVYGEGLENSTVTVPYGASVISSLPDVPVVEGKHICGWVPVMPETMPAEDLVLSALWTFTDVDEGNMHTVYDKTVEGDRTTESSNTRFDDGVSLETVVVTEGDKITASAIVSTELGGFSAESLKAAVGKISSELQKLNGSGDVTKSVRISMGSDSRITGDVFAAAADADAPLTLIVENGYLALGTDACRALSGAGPLSLSVIPDPELTGKTAETVGDRKVFDVSLTGEGFTGKLGGDAVVTLDYLLTEGQTSENVCVYYVDGDGNRTAMDTHYENGKLSFSTDHLSVYMVDIAESPAPSGSSGGGSNTGLIIGAAVAVIAVLGILGFLYMRKQKTP